MVVQSSSSGKLESHATKKNHFCLSIYQSAAGARIAIRSFANTIGNKKSLKSVVGPTWMTYQCGVHQGDVAEVQAPRKLRGRSKMSKVHARGPDDKVVMSLNEDGQPISEEKKELSNFLGTLVKDNVSLTYINWHVVPVQLKNEMMEYTLARYVIPEEGHKWVMHTLNEAWRRHKSLMKNAHYKKFATDEQRIENRPNTIPLEDFKMLLKYWGDESVQALAEDNAARRNTISETHTLGPITLAQAKEKLRKDKKLAKPSDAEIYLETYKREPGKTYKADTEKLRTKYMKVQELVKAGKIDEANAVVTGGRTHGRNWLVGRRGKKSVQSEQNITPAAPSDSYVQELTEKIQQNLEAGFMAKVNTIQQNLEAGFMAKVNTKVKENMSWMLTKLGEDNPGLVFDVKELCATASSNYDDSGTPTTQGATNE